jgi:hypothetical protein
MKINTLEMEWTPEGCTAKASGFTGVLLTCPRCGEQLPRDVEHKCGNAATPTPKKRTTKKKEAKS